MSLGRGRGKAKEREGREGKKNQQKENWSKAEKVRKER